MPPSQRKTTTLPKHVQSREPVEGAPSMAGLRPEGDEDMLSNRRSPGIGQPLPPRMRFILIYLPEGDSLLCSGLDLLPTESPVGNYPIEDSRIHG